MATYNRAHLISESLASISNQSFQNWECLIIDDGSKDDTAKITERFTKDSRFVYLQRTEDYKKGLPSCRNQGLDLAKGEFIVFFDDDDIAHPQLLELAVLELQNSDYDFCRYLRTTFNGQFSREFEFIKNYSSIIINQEQLESVIKNDLPFNSCQVMWRKTSIGAERFKESLMYAEEWELYSRLLLTGIQGISIDEILYFGRKHPESNTGEFYRKDKIRLASKIEATELVIQNLALKNRITPTLKHYFIRLGFQLGSNNIIDLTLKNTNSGFFEKLKYKSGLYLYPILRPLFVLKGHLKSS